MRVVSAIPILASHPPKGHGVVQPPPKLTGLGVADHPNIIIFILKKSLKIKNNNFFKPQNK